MWLFTTRGFYSAVQDRDDPDTIIVRARVRADLEATGWPIEETPDADCAFRARVTRQVWADFSAASAIGIVYDNFKASVADTEYERAALYRRLWAVLRELQVGARRSSTPTSCESASRGARPDGQGGV